MPTITGRALYHAIAVETDRPLPLDHDTADWWDDRALTSIVVPYLQHMADVLASEGFSIRADVLLAAIGWANEWRG